MSRRMAGFLFAPLAAPVAGWLGMTVLLVANDTTPGFRKVFGLLALLIPWIVIGGPVSYAGSAVLGLPVVAALRRTGRMSFARLVRYGAMAGVITWTVFSLAVTPTSFFEALTSVDVRTSLKLIAIGAGFGTAVAATYWAIAGREAGEAARRSNISRAR